MMRLSLFGKMVGYPIQLWNKCFQKRKSRFINRFVVNTLINETPYYNKNGMKMVKPIFVSNGEKN